MHYIQSNKLKSQAYSIADVKTAYLNQNMLNLFFTNFQVQPEMQNNKQAIDAIIAYGALAA